MKRFVPWCILSCIVALAAFLSIGDAQSSGIAPVVAPSPLLSTAGERYWTEAMRPFVDALMVMRYDLEDEQSPQLDSSKPMPTTMRPGAMSAVDRKHLRIAIAAAWGAALSPAPAGWERVRMNLIGGAAAIHLSAEEYPTYQPWCRIRYRMSSNIIDGLDGVPVCVRSWAVRHPKELGEIEPSIQEMDTAWHALLLATTGAHELDESITTASLMNQGQSDYRYLDYANANAAATQPSVAPAARARRRATTSSASSL